MAGFVRLAMRMLAAKVLLLRNTLLGYEEVSD